MSKKNKTVLIIVMVILFIPFAYLGWLARGGRLTKAGMFKLDVQEPWIYFIWPGFIAIAIVYYYLFQAYYKD